LFSRISRAFLVIMSMVRIEFAMIVPKKEVNVCVELPTS